jgi:hypothetical protein
MSDDRESHSCAPECAEHPFSSGYDWSRAIQAVTPYDLTAEPKTHVLVQPGWGERLAELAPRAEPGEDHG